MKVLAVGGAGYVGSHCVRALIDEGCDVVVFDNLRTGHRAAVDRRATFVQADLSDAAALDSVFSSYEIEGVMHFAGSLDVGESVREPLVYYRNNVCNTVNLLEAMQAHGVRRLVFSSTCATYGIPSAVPITEDAPQNPISPYGRSKFCIEWILRDCAHAWGLSSTALRYFNAAGAAKDAALGEDHEPEIHLIPRVLMVALGKEPHVNIFGVDYPTVDGTCIRDYIHVEDLADAHARALLAAQDGTFRCYNLGTGNGASVRQVIEAARLATGNAIDTVEGPRREGDPPELFANPAKAIRELGWKPQYTNIVDVVATAWKWMRSNPSGYKGMG